MQPDVFDGYTKFIWNDDTRVAKIRDELEQWSEFQQLQILDHQEELGHYQTAIANGEKGEYVRLTPPETDSSDSSDSEDED